MAASKKKAPPSKHSRAARRNEPIDINTDKSLKDLPLPPRTAPHRPSVLAAQNSAGISKKLKRGRQMSAKARKRAERAGEMAEAVAERTSVKLARSLEKAGTVDYRRKGWERINRDAEEEEEVAKRILLEQGMEEEEEDGDGDGDGDVVVEESVAEPVTVAPVDNGYLAIDDDEEIL